jgi:hypothetical protein
MQNWNVELFSPECTIQVDFWAKYALKVFLPFILTFLILIIQIIQFIWRNRVFTLKLFVGEIVPKFGNMLQWLFVAFYTSSISTTISAFNCQKQLDGTYTMFKDSSVTCFDAAWYSHSALIGFSILLYFLIVPVVLASIFIKHRKDHGSSQFLRSYGLLVSPYKIPCYFWEVMVMLKRACFVISTDFFSGQSKYVVSVGVLLVFFWIEATFLPYSTKSANVLNLT